MDAGGWGLGLPAHPFVLRVAQDGWVGIGADGRGLIALLGLQPV